MSLAILQPFGNSTVSGTILIIILILILIIILIIIIIIIITVTIILELGIPTEADPTRMKWQAI